VRYIIIPLIFIHIFISGVLYNKRESIPKIEVAGYFLPSRFLKLTSLEFRQIVSDFLFLKTSIFLGGKVGPGGKLNLKREEWIWIYNALDVITDLDPYFLDPYIFGEGILTWEAGMVKEMNILLLKGIKYRDWDWNIPFSIGFNYFYFLKNRKMGAYYIMKASVLPGSFFFLPQLAARLKYESGDTYGAIIFLKNIYNSTANPTIKASMRMRIKALESIYFLERGVIKYRGKYGRNPEKIDDLVKKGIIENIPEDPYGGVFYIDQRDGRIKTTSRLAIIKK
jgi:hypothetical protein